MKQRLWSVSFLSIVLWQKLKIEWKFCITRRDGSWQPARDWADESRVRNSKLLYAICKIVVDGRTKNSFVFLKFWLGYEIGVKV